jgi:acetyl-CoA acetyltransferase
MEDVYVVGTGMTRFKRSLGLSMKEMSRDAVEAVLADALMTTDDVGAIFFSNSLAGLITGQECIRGEVMLYPLGFGTIPIHNVENACASGGNAVHLAWLAVASGMCDTAMALGVEKANHEDKTRTFSAYGSGTDIDAMFAVGEGAGTNRTPLVDRQAALARMLIDERGLTVKALAKIAEKAYAYGKLNPMAHRQEGHSIEVILGSRLVVDPITTLMSSPVSDGAAAVIVSRKKRAGINVRITGSAMASRPPMGASNPTSAEAASHKSLAMAGVGVDEVDVAEVHDASVAYEAIAWRETGLCPPGSEFDWAMSEHTALRGKLPINPSGGLISRGHALGASGIAQIHELVIQLRGEGGARQVQEPRIAMAQIGGGVIDWQTSVSSVHVLVRDEAW